MTDTNIKKDEKECNRFLKKIEKLDDSVLDNFFKDWERSIKKRRDSFLRKGCRRFIRRRGVK